MAELQNALRGSEERLNVVLDALGEAVTIRGRDEHLIFANGAALERMGVASLEELRRADPRALMEGWETVGEDGREIRLDDLPSMRALAGERPEPLMLRTVHRETGEQGWVLLKATAVRGQDGLIEAPAIRMNTAWIRLS